MSRHRDQCKRGHAYAEHGAFDPRANGGRGQRRCRLCVNLSKQRRTRARAGCVGPVLVPSGSFRSLRMRQVWIARRERFGPNGLSPEGRAKSAAALRRRLAEHGHPMAKKTHCVHGHRYEPGTVYINARGARECRVCRRRPLFVMGQEGVRVDIRVHDAWYRLMARQLRRRMIAAHPDKTRRASSVQFQQARRAWERFLAKEAGWYASFHLRPPVVQYRGAAPRRVLDTTPSWRREKAAS